MLRTLGIIPAAGKGTRLSLPYPKELLPVTSESGRIVTVLESNIIQLSNAGIKDAVVIINHEKEIIRTLLGDQSYGVHLHYVYQEQKLSQEGLPDAVTCAATIAIGFDLCIMLMADVYFTDLFHTDLLYRLAESSDADVLVSLWKTQEPWRFGIVERSGHRITNIIDKPTTMTPPQFFWGAIAFRKSFWPFILEEQETFSHALSRAASFLTIVDSPTYGEYLDLGTPSSYIDGILEINRE